MNSESEAVRIVGSALRYSHCVTGQKAHIIVTVTPEAAARTAVKALMGAGFFGSDQS